MKNQEMVKALKACARILIVSLAILSIFLMFASLSLGSGLFPPANNFHMFAQSTSAGPAAMNNWDVQAYFVSDDIQPIVNSVTYTPNPVGLYEKLELSVDLTASYTNPFNPDDIDLWAVFTSPSLETWNVKGFWDGAQWKIRFAANEIGEWNFTVYVDDQEGQSNSSSRNFTVMSSSHHGWLRVSPSDPHFLNHDDGSSFYGIGHCRPWNLDEAPDLFSDMQSHGMNTLVYWMPHWDNMLVTMGTGYDHYDMVHAANIDNVVEDAEQNDIYLMLTIWNHDELRGDGHSWGNTYFEEYNPFSSLSDADGFMSDATSWSYQEKLYRYIIARWGFSRAIGQWHTVCEIDGTTNIYNNDALTDPWHNNINDYFKTNDPFSHPTTASKAGDMWWPNGYSVMDIPQIHTYDEASDEVAIADRVAYWTREMWNNYDKPNVIGEFGTSSEGLQPMHFHNGIWASLSAGAAITALDWNDGGSFGDLSPEMYDHASYLADFISGIQFDQLGVDPTSLSIDTEFKAWGMNGDNYGYLWVQDTSPGESNSGTSLTISGLTDGGWELNWYNTWTGDYYAGPITASASGNAITTTIPDFTNDIALRIAFDDSPTNQAPYEPTLVQPVDGAMEVSITPTLEVTVTDPDSDPMDVAFYGREVGATSPGEDFTIIALPDTQYYSESYPDIFSSQIRWIVDNEMAKNTVFVTHLGDLVQTANSELQWQNADAALDLLDPTGISYSVGPGNHDLPIYTSPSYYNDYFGISRFSGNSWYGGYYGSDNYNNYSLFSTSGMDFILINLQYAPDTEMLNWADALLKANPDRQGIVVSHSILNINDTFTYEGTTIFNALKDNVNLFLMLCGHTHSPTDGAARRMETGDYENTIHVLMADYQDYPNGGNGYLRVMEFSPTDEKIYVETYSPWLVDNLPDPANQFELDFVIDSSESFEMLGSVSNINSGNNASISWSGLDPDTEYEWYVEVHDASTTTTGQSWGFTTIPTYDLTVNVVGNGSVTLDPAGSFYLSGTTVDLTATADPGWIFTGWSDDLSGMTNPESITIDADKTVTANFAPDCSVIPPSAVQVDIAQDATDVLLSWADAAENTGGYQVYRSVTPYFSPGEATKLGDPLPAGSTSYTDVGATGAPGTSYFYIVQALNCDGSLTADSTMVGIYNFALISGSP